MTVPKELTLNDDDAIAINHIVGVLHGYNKFAGWHDKPREVGTDLMLITSELAEAMEGARKNLKDDHLTEEDMFAVELADAFIRLADTAGKYNVNLGDLVVKKALYNQSRADHKKEAREAAGGKTF